MLEFQKYNSSKIQTMALTSCIAVLVALFPTFIIADQDVSLYNKNYPDFVRALAKGCSINDDNTEIKCQTKRFSDKELSLNIKINKCEEPVTVNITITVFSFSWKKTFHTSNQKAGLSIKPFEELEVTAGVYLHVNLEDTGSNLQLKIIILTGVELLGNFKELTKDTIADSNLPKGTFECGWCGPKSGYLYRPVCAALYAWKWMFPSSAVTERSVTERSVPAEEDTPSFFSTQGVIRVVILILLILFCYFVKLCLATSF